MRTTASALPSDGIDAQDEIPDYLSKTYRWAYLSPRTMAWLDRPSVVSAILWGNANRLVRATVGRIGPAERVLQAACVYGRLSTLLADRVGLAGQLTVTDVAQVQLDNLATKIDGRPQVCRHLGDLARGNTGVPDASQDAVVCFFLLHEVPPEPRQRIVEALLRAVRVGGRVIFTDYHKMRRWHPLRPVMALVFSHLEPYAKSLLDQELSQISPVCQLFHFEKRTRFGGLYQEVVATRLMIREESGSR